MTQSVFGCGAARFLLIVLLAASIIFPSGLLLFKAGVFLLVLVILSIGMLTGRISLSPALYLLSLLYALVGLAWSLYGEMLRNPGAMKVMTVMVVYPIALPLFSPLYQQKDESSLYRLFLVSAWVIVAIDLVYAFTYFTAVGSALRAILTYIYGDFNTDVQINPSSISIHLKNVDSIIFLLPFFLSVLFSPKARTRRGPVYLIVLLMFIAGLLANRRALLVTAILGPLIAFLITTKGPRNQHKSGKSRWWVLGFAIAVIGCMSIAIDSSVSKYYIDLIGSTFNFTDNDSNLLRVYQFHSLMNGIYDSPLLGHGAGAVASVIRSDETPWLYELTYVAFIFQYGIMWFLLYACGIAFLCWQLTLSIASKGRASFEFYILSGFISFMLANATNPYLGQFDYMWILFIPYALVNRRLLRDRLRTDIAPSPAAA